MEIERIPVATLLSGAELAIWVHESRGELGPGPTVGVAAAIHGDEPTGTEICLELARRLRVGLPHRGRILILPVANPLAYEAVRRHTPLDDLNLNRLFPGDPDGWLSDRLARVITRHFLERIDAFVDLHSGGDSQTVDYVYLLNDERLSRSFGSRVLYRPREGFAGTRFEGTSATVTQARGIPTVTVELGGGRVDQRPYVERGVRGVLNLLRALGVVEGEPEPPGPQVVVHEIATIRPGQGGLLETEAPPLGEVVPGGAVLGRVVSPHTFEELEVIRSPFRRGVMILSHLTRDVVWPGDYGYMVGNLEGAEGA